MTELIWERYAKFRSFDTQPIGPFGIRVPLGQRPSFTIKEGVGEFVVFLTDDTDTGGWNYNIHISNRLDTAGDHWLGSGSAPTKRKALHKIQSTITDFAARHDLELFDMADPDLSSVNRRSAPSRRPASPEVHVREHRRRA